MRDAVPGIKILQMYHADDMIDAVFIYKDTGKFRFGKDSRDLFFCGVDRHGFEIHAVRENIFGVPLGKFDGIAQKFAFALVDTASLLDFVNQHQQFFL